MEVLIDKLDNQGRGIAYVDNKITFIENALEDEIVDIEIVKMQKKFNEAIVRKYIKKSSNRIQPICPYYEICGGCNLMHLSYEDQLLYKENKIRDILKKYAQLDDVKINSIVPSPDQFNYRNKVTLKNNGMLGYYKRKSNDIVNIEYCYLVNDVLNKKIKELNSLKIDSEINEIVLRSINETDLSLTLSLQDDLKDCSKYINLFNKVTLLRKNNIENLTKESNIFGRLGKYEFMVSPTAFFQVNTKQAENLYNKILEYVKEEPNKELLDLYCGTGTIGIYVSEYAKKVIGIEINSKAIEDAKINAKINNVNNIEFYSGDTKNILSRNNFKADIVIVDPPRAGLDKEVIDDLFNIDSQKIIYVSCDPITLARDLKLLQDKYNVLEVTPFDMFPNTYHCESVVILERK